MRQTFKLKLKTQYVKPESVKLEQVSSSDEDSTGSTRGTKRKWCGKEIVNSEEVRRKNREAQKKSRKKRKLAKMKMESELQDLRERNESLTSTVNTLTRQNLDRVKENEELKLSNEELLKQVETLRASHEKLQKDLEELKANGLVKKGNKETSAVFRTADSGWSQQRTVAEDLILMLSIQLLAIHCPIYLQALLQTCSKNKIPLATLLSLVIKKEITLQFPNLLDTFSTMNGLSVNEHLITGGRRNLSVRMAHISEQSSGRWRS